MAVGRFHIRLNPYGRTDVIDLTSDIARRLQGSALRNGAAIPFVPGSTAAQTTTEYESGAANDLGRAMKRMPPEGIENGRDRRWREGRPP